MTFVLVNDGVGGRAHRARTAGQFALGLIRRGGHPKMSRSNGQTTDQVPLA
jgi:hypothetical protein